MINTLDNEIVERLSKFAHHGRHVTVDSQTMLALLDYIQKLERVSQYADSVAPMLAQNNLVGKAEALNERVRDAIDAAHYVNNCSTQLKKG